MHTDWIGGNEGWQHPADTLECYESELAGLARARAEGRMLDQSQERYTVGTDETGSFCGFNTLEEARAEAKAWALSEPGTVVYIWATAPDGSIRDVVTSYGMLTD